MGLFSRIRGRSKHSGTQADTSIVENKSSNEKEELLKLIETTKRDLEFWHKTFRSFSVIPCAYCGKQMRIYPYGGAYYTGPHNEKIHAACYDDYLSQERDNDLPKNSPKAKVKDTRRRDHD